MEFLEKTTSIDKPFFSWNPTTNEVSDEISDEGIAVMGVDILPTELRLVCITGILLNILTFAHHVSLFSVP